MSARLLSDTEVQRALAVRDLTDPREGAHVMQRLVDDVIAALRRLGPVDVSVLPGRQERIEFRLPPELARAS